MNREQKTLITFMIGIAGASLAHVVFRISSQIGYQSAFLLPFELRHIVSLAIGAIASLGLALWPLFWVSKQFIWSKKIDQIIAGKKWDQVVDELRRR